MRCIVVSSKWLVFPSLVISLIGTMALMARHLGANTARLRSRSANVGLENSYGIALASLSLQVSGVVVNVPTRSEGVAKGPDGRYYVVVPDNPVPGNGKIKAISGDPFAGTAMVSDVATGLNSPLGMVFVGNDMFVVDWNMVWKINTSGEKSVFLAPSAFPGGNPALGIPGGALSLNGIDADANGNLYMADSTRSVIWKATQQGVVSIFLNNGPVSPLTGPNNVLVDTSGQISGKAGSLLVTDSTNANLVAIAPDASAAPVIATGLGRPDGMTFDAQGNFYISDVGGGRVFRMRPDKSIEVILTGLTSPSDIWVDKQKRWLIVPSISSPRFRFYELQ